MGSYVRRTAMQHIMLVTFSIIFGGGSGSGFGVTFNFQSLPRLECLLLFAVFWLASVSDGSLSEEVSSLGSAKAGVEANRFSASWNDPPPCNIFLIVPTHFLSFLSQCFCCSCLKFSCSFSFHLVTIVLGDSCALRSFAMKFHHMPVCP